VQQPEIRPAGVADAEAGAWCHLQCWQEAYADLVDPAKLAERTADLETRIKRWTTAAEDGGMPRWIALNPDPQAPVRERVIGFVAVRPNRDEDAPTPLEVQAIYTRKAWWGTGLGSRLMEIAIGNQPASLWVLEGNERALAFYHRKGFVADGTVADDPFFGVTELRMVRR
jgi:GNAT superfamily N-acetyltransferase